MSKTLPVATVVVVRYERAECGLSSDQIARKEQFELVFVKKKQQKNQTIVMDPGMPFYYKTLE
jgi:hypothetical protein